MSYIYLLLLIAFNVIESRDKLVFLLTHFRHGSRAPQRFYSGYQDYVKETWEKPGELTGSGQRMHYLLGLRNRIKYVNEKKFLSEKFDPHEILIYSSPFNRTIGSVAAQLQGLYPQNLGLGEYLTEEQEELAKPQVNIDYDLINEQIIQLNHSALPNSMVLPPIRMINLNERKIILYDIKPCTIKREEIKDKNNANLDSIKNIVKEFKEKYGAILDAFYGTTKNDYNMHFIDNFCDAFVSGYTDNKEMKEFHKTGVNFEEVLDYCFEYNKINFRDWISGDDEKVLSHLEMSKLMKEFIHLLKQRVDADINHEDIEKKYEDYSRPKMMMISGHDSTTSCWQIILMAALNKTKDFYTFPKFGTQLAFEVTTNPDNTNKKDYSDYFINYYFNDDLKLNITVKEFIEKMTPHIWTDQQIDEFCGFEVITENNRPSASNALAIVFIILTGIFFLTSVVLLILLIKLMKKKNIHESMDDVNDSLVPKDDSISIN